MKQWTRLKERSNLLEAEVDEKKLELVEYYCNKYAVKLASNKPGELNTSKSSIRYDMRLATFPKKEGKAKCSNGKGFGQESGDLFSPRTKLLL